MTSTVSVVLPVRNGARWIGDALRSVVGQSRRPDEIIVIDGQSEDGSAEIAASYDRVRVMRQPALGLYAAFNLGFSEAQGDFIAPIAADDIWRPEKLALQSDLLERDPSLDVVFGRVQYFVSGGDGLPPSVRPGLLEGSRAGPLLEMMMIRRSVIQRVGPFRTDLAIAADVDWFARLADAGACRAMPDEVLLEKRLHGGALSCDAGRTQQELLLALRDAVVRRRNRMPG